MESSSFKHCFFFYLPPPLLIFIVILLSSLFFKIHFTLTVIALSPIKHLLPLSSTYSLCQDCFVGFRFFSYKYESWKTIRKKKLRRHRREESNPVLHGQ